MNNLTKIGGTALILFVFCFFVVFVLESFRESLGYQDADNPGVMMRYLNERIDLFTLSGIINVLMSILLTISVLSIYESFGKNESALTYRFGAIFALFAAAYFFANGVLRIQVPGTLLHMGKLKPEWGEAGILAVQMAGTQGLASAGGFAVSVWVLSTSIFNFRARVFWKGLSWFGLATIAMLFGAFVGPFLPGTDLVYPIYILGLLIAYIWCLTLGINLLKKPIQ